MTKRILCFLLLILLLWAGAACAESVITKLEQLNAPGITIGVGQGDIAELVVKKELPQATISYFDDKFMGYTAVAQGKIDAFAYDRRQMELSIENGQKGVHLLEETLNETMKIAVGISPVSKIPDLTGKINRFIAELRANGTLDDMFDRWVIRADETMPDIPRADNPSVHLTVGTSGIVPPYSYYVGKELNGYDIELAYRFAAWLGADVQFKVYDYGAIVPAAMTGDIDCIMANLEYSEEREDEMPYSDILFEVKIGLMVRWDAAPASTAIRQETSALDAMNGKRMGIVTGTSFEAPTLQYFPDSQYLYFSTNSDVVTALTSNKIDGFLADEPVIRMICKEVPEITYLSERITQDDYAFGFAKNSERADRIRGQFNEMLAQIMADGTMNALYDKWFGDDEAAKTVDLTGFSGENGQLNVVTNCASLPFSYIKDGEMAGIAIELVEMFCRRFGYTPSIEDVDSASRIPGIVTGKYDMCAFPLTITEERRESINFSDPYYQGGIVLALRKADAAALTAESASASGQDTASGQAAGTVRWQDYNGKRLGVLVGPLMEDAAKEYFPDSEYLLFNSYPDCIAALLAGKIDAYLGDELGLFAVHAEQPEIDYIHDRITQNNYAFAFRKNDPDSAALCAELNDFLKRSRENGTMEDLENIWYGIDEEKKVVDLSDLTGENGTIRVVTTSTDAPFSYIKDGKNVGYDIDLVVRFCRDRGYALELGDVDFAGRIPAIQSGKYDFTTDMNVTPEREEQALFSDPTGYGGIVLAVLSSDLAAADASRVSTGAESSEKSFLNSVQDSFYKTFIRENRWELFVNGVLTTLLITVLSILFGTASGFFVFMLCRNGNIVANGVTRFSMWLVQGMPMVVLLMILYYIIFGSVAISGIAVAVIGFTLTFGASVFGLLKMGVGTIDRGQYEAAYALGYANRRTFFRIILPQAIPHILPAYKGEIVGLIKATAIVGYIAVQDLTKMGDIVRSRTYEAFFPLIAVTVIYFILEGLLGFLVSKIQIRMNPKKRKPENILKGDEPPTTASGRNIVGGEISRNEQCPHEADLRQLRLRESMIKIEHLKKVYPNITPLKDVSVEIHDGDVISVIGPSGTGKSTLLRCINLLEKPTEGHIWVNGTDVTDPKCDLGKVRQKMGMVFQSFNLFGHLTVIENIMLAPMDLLGKSKQEAYDEGIRLLRTVGLAEKALNYPDELSGGQKQRIAIARTLAMDPDIILLDEPTSALDPTMVGEVQAVIRDLSKTGKTLMIVTHEMNFARAISNRVFYMDEGGIYEDGSPEQIFDHPQRENTRRFIRKLKVLELNIDSRDYDFLGMAGEIDQYCNKNQIPYKTAHRVRLAFEELVQQMLIPTLAQPDIQTVIEYSEAEESAVLTVRYNGPAFDVTAKGEALPLKVLKSAVSDMAYTWDDNAERPNQVTMHIRTA